MVATLSPAICSIALAVCARQWIRGRELLLLAGRDRHGNCDLGRDDGGSQRVEFGFVFVESSKIEAGTSRRELAVPNKREATRWDFIAPATADQIVGSRRSPASEKTPFEKLF
jgi:hypothetical protein